MAYPDMTPGPPFPAPAPTTTGDTGSTATGSFDVDGAKKAGYSDAEIADHLAASAKFDAPAARKAGYSDKELIAHLTASADPAAGLEGTEEGFQAGYAQRFPQPAPRPPARSAPPPGEPPPPPQDEYSGAPVSTDVAEVDPNASAVGRIGKALVEGATSPPFLTPEAKAQAERENQGTWVGRNIVSPTVSLSELPFRGLNALSGGLGQLAYEVGTGIGGPAAGRDFFMANQLLPVLPGVGGMPHPSVIRAPGAPPGPPPGGRYVSERTAPPRPPGMTDAERMQQLIQHDIVETNPAPGFVPPGTPRPDAGVPVHDILRSDPAQGLGRPAEIPPTTTKDPVTGEVKPIESPPQPTAGETAPPAGAQVTPATQAGLTPEQAAAAGSTADKQWYYKTIIPGEANRIQYIKGINPTMAQQELTVNAARESKNLRRLSEEADQNERALLAQHSDIRKNEFQNVAGSDTTQQTDMKAASDQIERDLQAAYAHGGTVDLQPVIDAAQTELTGSAGKLPPVKAAMKAVMDAAQKDDGTGLETDPRQANAVRRAIIYMQSKEGRLENPGYGSPDVMAALTRVKDVLTKQVEPAAPGFTKANADYAAARQAADAREALQAYEPKLYQGSLGNMTFAPFHRLMGEIIAGRDPRAPMNPYKALTEEQFNRLKSLHDDLQRVASAQELANAAGGGSDTGQTLFDMAKKAARTGVSTAGGAATGFAVGHVFGHEAGMAAGMFTQRALDNLFSQRAVAQATAEHNRLLRPDLTQYPLKPNPLMNPPPP